MLDLIDSLAESLERIASLVDEALGCPWRSKDMLRAHLAEVLALATHAAIEADDLRLLADLADVSPPPDSAPAAQSPPPHPAHCSATA